MKRLASWSKVDKWLLAIGGLYAVVLMPIPVGSRWYIDHVTVPLRQSGQNWIVELLFFPPLAIAVITSAILPRLFAFVTVSVYAVGLSMVLGRAVLGLWQGFLRLRGPLRGLTIVLLLATIALAARAAIPESRMVVPASVAIGLATSVAGSERVPVLRLAASTREYCDIVHPLQVRAMRGVDELRIGIDGYRITSSGTILCHSSDAGRSIAKIPVDVNWLRSAGTARIAIRLVGRESRYEARLHGYLFTLAPLEVSSAVIEGYDRCLRRPIRAGEPAAVILAPVDVGAF